MCHSSYHGTAHKDNIQRYNDDEFLYTFTGKPEEKNTLNSFSAHVIKYKSPKKFCNVVACHMVVVHKQ